MKQVKYFFWKVSPTLRYSHFCPDLISHVGKRFDKKAKVSCKIFDATTRKKNNFNTHIAQHFKK